MPIATGLAIGLGVAGAAASAGGAIAAGSIQAGAARDAASLQAQEADKSLAFQEKEFSTQQANEAPFLATGQASARQLAKDVAPGGDLVQPWTQPFTAPTDVTEQNDPGYKFRLQQGQKALEDSAAARGGVLSTGTAEDLTKFGQNYASNEYGQVYSRAVDQFTRAYDVFRQNQTDIFNKRSATAGGGQVAAGQLGQEGAQAAGTVANINEVAGSQIGASINNAGAATASGYAGAANALTAGITNTEGLLTLQQILAKQKNG